MDSTTARGLREAAAGMGRPRPGVLGTYVRRELREVAASRRFHASALIVLTLMALGGFAHSVRHRVEQEQWQSALAAYSEKLEQATVADLSELRHPAIKAPWKLSFLATGGQHSVPDSYDQALSAWVSPRLSQPPRDDDRLGHPATLDWAFAISVAFPLVAIGLFFDAVCDERRAGTLGLLLSHPLRRSQLIAGKFLAAATSLALLFLLGAALNLMILTLYGGLRFELSEVVKIGLTLLLGLWGIGCSVLLVLLVSTLNREAATSLAVLMLIWVTAVVVIPAASALLAQGLQSIPTTAEIEERAATLRVQVLEEYDQQARKWRSPEVAKADDYAWERVSAAAANRRYALEEELHRGYVREKLAQVELARTLAWLSPTFQLQDLAERLIGSALWRDRAFLRQAWAFRQTLAEWLREQDAADPESPHLLFFADYLSRRPVDAEAVPRFIFREQSVREGLAAAAVPLALLLLETALLGAAALYAIGRCEVE